MGRFTKIGRLRMARRKFAWCWPVGFAIAAKSLAALAEANLTPYASGAYEHQSNPLYQWSGTPPPASASADSIVMLKAGLDARSTWSRQTLAATVEVRRFDYGELGFLDRTEQLLDTRLQWGLTSRVDGTVGYRHEYRMVPLEEVVFTRQLLMETEDSATASLNLQSAPEGWRLESRLSTRDLDSPRAGLPDLNLRETALHEAVRRALRGFFVGFDAEYLSGSYSGAGHLGTPHYHQTTLQLAAERPIEGFASFEGALGYTRREDSIGGEFSTLTGLLGYHRELTGKTSVEAVLRRFVDSYVTGMSSQVDTSLILKMAWQPTAKIEVAPHLMLMHSAFPGQSFAPVSARHDSYWMVALEARYQMLEWLAIHPYVRHAARSSNVPSFGFDANALGVELVFKESR